ncbi:acyl-protein synthetase [Motilimonas cestriensis]|uniref:Acyl-protein synthetase n=1 Tax=Motilimonas cestriensis TaxID=2742685 RepID=A0ABS8WBV6_9GAMM|nr:acyl-protein synthetase [Motilimonas cestriensis]MCE2595587.1 acyl-protein synthetase [Motilimonas cestriensis]
MIEIDFDAIYSQSKEQKNATLLAQFNQLTEFHYQHCQLYKNIIDTLGLAPTNGCLELVPFLSTQLFKELELVSVPKSQIIKTLTSSGTTSAKVAKIYLDADTAKLQAKSLVKIMQCFSGKQRLPMLFMEPSNLIADRRGFSARGAGVQGFALLGRDHHYALNPDMSINWQQLEQFFTKYQGQKVLIFGFTFMIWQYFYQAVSASGKTLPPLDAIVFHGGGWKKLAHLAVGKTQFNQAMQQLFGKAKVHNFYGMVEQTGSIFVECEHGHLHAPNCADIILRSEQDLSVINDFGQQGIIQVLSALPHSYPGHSILTEDLGRILGEDTCSCGRKGRYFEVLGRIKKSENRGCSDTYQEVSHD